MRTRRGLGPSLLMAVGTCGVLVALGLGVTHHRELERDLLEHDLAREAQLGALSLEDHFDLSSSVNLILADNPAFRNYYEDEGLLTHAHDGEHEHGAATISEVTAPLPDSPVITEVNRALSRLETLFPGSIGEACFIDVRGWENARVVRGEVAAGSDLSPDETGAPFFTPTVEGAMGVVHQATPYVSPDTGEWVISNSTLIDMAGAAPAMVHFEVTLDSFRDAIVGSDGYRSRIIDAADGDVMLDSEIDARPADDDSLGTFTVEDVTPGVTRITADGGHPVALARITREAGADNVNDWIVAVSAPFTPTAGVRFNEASAMLLVLGLLLIGGGNTLAMRGAGQLRKEIETDALTGLANRGWFVRELSQRFERDGGAEWQVMALDLDNFRLLNDRLGHQVGDQLLVDFASRLSDVVPDGSLVARAGGDEFLIALPLSRQPAAGVIGALVDAMGKSFELQQGPVLVGASMGVSSFPHDAVEADQVLRKAALALQKAKDSDLTFVWYSTTLDPDNPRRRLIEERLAHAMEHHEVRAQFQPQIDISSQAIVGFEALARWEDAELGRVSPGEFIPVAQHSGMMPTLTAAMLEQAVDFLSFLPADHGLKVSVNVSPTLLVGGWLVRAVRELLAVSAVPAHGLVIELTEDLLVGDSTEEFAALDEIRSLGCEISIDDFGTGHSSLSYLSRLPADELKIDRSFVTDLEKDGSKAFILQTTVELGQRLGLRVVAEGVETAETLALLSAVGCDIAQGWLYAAAMPPGDAVAWAREHTGGYRRRGQLAGSGSHRDEVGQTVPPGATSSRVARADLAASIAIRRTISET